MGQGSPVPTVVILLVEILSEICFIFKFEFLNSCGCSDKVFAISASYLHYLRKLIKNPLEDDSFCSYGQLDISANVFT